MKLYELVGAYKQVQELLEEGHDLQDTLESIETSFEEKVEATCKVKLNMEAQITAIKAEEKRLQEKRKSLENQREKLVAYLETQLKNANIQKMRAGIHDVQFNLCPPSVEITDQSLIPKEFIKQELVEKPDKILMHERLKSGEEIPGVKLVTDKKKLKVK